MPASTTLPNLDPNVTVNMYLDNPPVEDEAFGVALVGTFTVGTGFTERVLTFENNTDAQASAKLSTAAKAACAAAFAQTGVATVKVGRLNDVTYEVWTVTVSTAQAGVYTVTPTLNGTALGPYAFTATTQTASQIVDGILALMNADSALLALVTLVDGGASFTITTKNEATTLTVTDNHSVTPGNITAAQTTAAITVADALDDIKAADPVWYGLSITSRTDNHILAAAAWIESDASRIFLAQSDGTDIYDGGDTSDVLSQLAALSYERTALLWYQSDAVFADFAWMAERLHWDLDVQSPSWYDVTLSGVVVSTLPDTTAKAVVLSKGGNVYLPQYGTNTTDPGKMVNGQWIDAQVIGDFLRSRSADAIAAIKLAAANRGTRIPYTKAGFETLVAGARSVFRLAERVGHLVEGSTVFTVPDLASISNTDRTNRRFTFSATATLAGGIRTVTFNGYLTA